VPIHETEVGWILETDRAGYAFGLDRAGRLAHRYWGLRLPYPADYPPPPPAPVAWASFNDAGHLTPEEYPGYGGLSYVDPCLKVTFADGVRDVVLRVATTERVDGDVPDLRIHLHDAYYPLRVTLHYRVHAAYDLIERWVTVANEGDAPVTLERVWSAQWHLPSGTEARNQLILNLARPDVQDYLIDALDRLLAAHDIAFVKWDMNRNVSESGWPDAPGDPREVWVRYVQGLYRVWGTLRERRPDVVWQSCSGGGGRADLGILRLADQIWVSDNTEATARLSIQEGFSRLFPAATMEAWVTDAGRGRVPLAFRFHVAMCGVLGVGGDLLHWSAEERAEAARWIALYKDIRPLVQDGDQYRLRSPQARPFSALMYVARDKGEAVLFAFRTHLPEPVELPALYPRGLDPDARYTVEGVDGARLGAAWMRAGVRIGLGDFESTVQRVRRV